MASLLTSAGNTATAYETGITPTSARITGAVAAAANHDVVVVLTNRAWTSTAQRTLVSQLNTTGKPVAVVAVRDPYDLSWVAGNAKVATYSYSPVTPGSLVRVLTGEVNPVGKLPVDLVSPTNVNTVVHPFGHGLGY